MSYTSEAESLLRFMDGLKQASGSAWQLAHAQQNPAWLTIRNLLENMQKTGSTLAMSRAVPRQVVLEQVARRQEILKKVVNGG